jgi:putative ABC transport system permease protein
MKSLAETHGIKFELVRHFLARMLDGEWSSTPGQWRNVVVGAFAMLVPAGLLIMREGVLKLNGAAANKYRDLEMLANPAPFRTAAIADQLALLTLVLAVTGLLALIQWQSFFPGRRDYISLAGLPVRSRQIFAARFATVMLFSAALVLVMNLLPSLIAPFEFGGRWQKNASYWVNAGAQGAACGLGCLFLLFAMVGLQGVLWNALPARWFTRVSVYVQGLLVGVLFFAALYSWSIRDWDERMLARLPELAAWAPPVWFLGLHEHLLGDPDPFFASMAMRAWIALASAAAAMALSYMVSYRRYRQLLVEAPVHIEVPRKRQWSFLHLLARQPQQEAVMQFMAKTLARSRANRTIWLAYIGAAFALMLNSSLIDGSFLARGGHGLASALKFAVLFWPLGISFIILTGIRHVLRLPAELPANWIFRLTETQGRKQWMQAVERFVLCYTLLPIYVVMFPVAVKAVGWGMAARMTVLQALVSLTLFDLLFYGWQQLPFTCSYVPGKRPMVTIVAGYMAALCALVPIMTVIIATAAQVAPLFVFYLIFFGGIWIWARRRRLDGWGQDPLLYEELPEGMPDLGISQMGWHGAAERTLRMSPIQPRIDPTFGQARACPTGGRSVWFATFWQDIRFATRQLWRNPGFTAIAALTIALGVGATTSIYTMLDVLIWQPIPLPDLNKLAMIVEAVPGQPFFWLPAAPADVESIRRGDTYLESLASWQLTMVNLVGSGGEALRLEAVRVSPNFLAVAGVQPAIGRAFLPSEDQPGHEREVILSDGMWRGHFGGDLNLVGRTIRLDGRNYTVVGIMPPGFYFPRPSRQIWIPLALTPEERTSRAVHLVDSGGRLSSGHTLAQFTAEVNGIASRLEQQYPATNAHRHFLAWSGQHYFSGGSLAKLYSAMLLGAALFVLLIACMNVANLQFARATGRWREIAVRTALGARRSRLVRQLVTESAALAMVGAALGLLLANWGLAILQAHVPAELVHYNPRLADMGLNRHALVFTLIAALASGILTGLAPAWRGSRANLTAGPPGPGQHRLRSVLVAAEVALAVVLLVGAGMTVRGFQTLASSSTALEPSSLLTLQLSLAQDRDPVSYYRQVLDRIAVLPGVRSAVAVTALPYSRHGNASPVNIEGRPVEPGKPLTPQVQSVTAGYFQSLRIPLRAGRLPSDADGPKAPRIAAISESMARRWWPDGTALGKRLQVDAGPWIQIVGVVGDIERSVIDRSFAPTVYFPFAQAPEHEMDIAIRTSGDARSLASAVRSTVRAVDPEQPILNLNTMTNLIEQEAFGVAYMAALMGAFGLLALALSSVGVYGVMAYVVSGQTHEIGIRMALGAPRGTVLAMLFRRGMWTALAGLLVGLIPAYGLARLIRAVVFGASSVGPAIFAIPLVLAFAAAIAIYIPARRALKIDPIAALRQE